MEKCHKAYTPARKEPTGSELAVHSLNSHGESGEKPPFPLIYSGHASYSRKICMNMELNRRASLDRRHHKAQLSFCARIRHLRHIKHATCQVANPKSRHHNHTRLPYNWVSWTRLSLFIHRQGSYIYHVKLHKTIRHDSRHVAMYLSTASIRARC